MNANLTAIQVINASWDEGGFLYKLRYRLFDKQLYTALYTSISRLSYEDQESIDKEVVRSLWFIPAFLHRQKRHVENIDAKEYDSLSEIMEDAIAGILGAPDAPGRN